MASAMNPTVKKEALDDQDREKRKERRNFSFSVANKRQYSVSGTMNQTVLEALRSSDNFNALLKKNKEKYVIIERKKLHHADIATHFPCRLLEEGEKLIIRFGRKTSVPKPHKLDGIPDQLITFYIARKGGYNLKTTPFLNNASHISIPYLCIYADLRKTVKDALERDGRFKKFVLGRGIELSCQDEADTLEMGREVNQSLDGKRFSLIMNKERRAEFSDFGPTTADQAVGPSPEQEESTPGFKKLTKAEPPADVQGESTPSQGKPLHKKPPREYQRIPGTEKLLQELRDQFEGLVKIMKEREKVKGRKEAVELLREEFGKNIEPLWRVQIGKLLMGMSGSVCYIKRKIVRQVGEIKEDIVRQGSGFRLFDCFVLTNAHVILDFSNISNDVQIISDRRDISVQVNFSFEQENITGPDLTVKRVVFGAFGCDRKMGHLDYALLELSVDTVKDLPPTLLPYYSPPALRGGVCIIGHPDGREKKFDFCSIIECQQREAVIEKNKNILHLMNRDCKIVAKDSPAMTYHSCFYHGSSGSPVFGVNGEVFALHSGGYSYKIDGRTMGVIEYAIPLQLILQHLLPNLKSSPDILEKIKKEANDPLQRIIAELDEPMEID